MTVRPMLAALALLALATFGLTDRASAQYPVSLVRQPPSAGGSGTAPTPDTSYEKLGFGTGIGTAVTTSTSNTKGACISLGTTAADWTAFTLNYRSTITTTSHLLDIATDSGCTAIIVGNLPIRPNLSVERQTLAVKVATGTTLYARMQSSAGGAQQVDLAMLGTVKQTGAFAGFNGIENLAADTSTSRGSSVAVPQTSVWTQISASTSRAYSGFAVGTSNAVTTPTLAQIYTCNFGTGAAASEAAFAAAMGMTNNNSTQGYVGALTSIFRSTPIGTRISAQAAATTTTPDTVGCVMMGYY